MKQDELPPTFWVWSCFWVVSASFFAFESALEAAAWLAELGPEVTLPPAMFTGTLALTAFWSLTAKESAFCVVSESCAPIWAAPAPPQPTWQDELSPTYWFWSCVCFVSASLHAFESALDAAAWLAELGPEVTLPPATFAGALALTAFW